MQFQSNIKTSSVQAANLLRDAILSRELKPGSRLQEIEISKSLGVSRSPIREAFRILEFEGLIKIVPNKGAHIIQLKEKDLREIYELRVLLESYGIRLACNKMTKDDLKKIEIIIQEMEKRIKSKDYIGYLKVSYEFHESYLEKCENERLFNLFRVLKNNILAVQIFAYSYPTHITDSMKEHRKIFTALSKRNQDKAEEYLRNHLKSGYERSKEFLNK